MASRKRLEDLSPAYRKRIENAFKRGEKEGRKVSLQEARRGKARLAKETAAGGESKLRRGLEQQAVEQRRRVLTTDQRSEIRAYVKSQARMVKGGPSPEAVWKAEQKGMLAWAEAPGGWERFKQLEAEQKARRGRGKVRTLRDLRASNRRYGLPPSKVWLQFGSSPRRRRRLR